MCTGTSMEAEPQIAIFQVGEKQSECHQSPAPIRPGSSGISVTGRESNPHAVLLCAPP